MKIRDLQPKLLYPRKLPFRIKQQIKSFSDKKKLKNFITTRHKRITKDKKINNKMAINTYLSRITLNANVFIILIKHI